MELPSHSFHTRRLLDDNLFNILDSKKNETSSDDISSKGFDTNEVPPKSDVEQEVASSADKENTIVVQDDTKNNKADIKEGKSIQT
ncbi:hypothetical protein A3Q56_07591 [Intoshia linei]|uniref:Uncharacterized protein n=1 Tax=Intoshia linei TaxID=1819745 RepID=A0A177AT47_9BILA|nr:hypothetical protein A3Q56_07591 [Intoshia linei]